MRRYILPAIIAYGSMISCSDSTGPSRIIGKYAFASYSTVSVITGEETDDFRPPLLPVITSWMIIDSLRDTVVLRPNYTYSEIGQVWGRPLTGGESVGFPFETNGTYTLKGSFITLTPNAGSEVGGGSGFVSDGTLEFDRYPGSWSFSKK